MPVIRRQLVAASVKLRRSQTARHRTPPSALDTPPDVEPWKPNETQFLFTVREAAEALATSRFQIRRFFQEGRLRRIRIGNRDKVDRREVIVLLEKLKGRS